MQGTASRSEAIRQLVRSAPLAATGTVDLPVTVRTELEQIVEDGWARDLGSAIDLVLTLGLRELAAVHAEAIPSLRRSASDQSARRAQRRRAEREGGALLRR